MKSIIKSTRFQQLLVISILHALVLFNVITTKQGEGLVNIITALLGASVVVRTIDRNIGDPKLQPVVSNVQEVQKTKSAATPKRKVR